MDRLIGIRLWDNKRENLENKTEQEVTMEESSKEGSGPRGAVLPDMMIMISSGIETRTNGIFRTMFDLSFSNTTF
ncbi:hypothetical protein TNCV_972521 [Trichonephila clavipes]|nr:hypothetical protein TNCV_972521 [Trichonephila clavipes]